MDDRTIALPEPLYAHCEVTRCGLRVAQVIVRCWQRHVDEPIAVARAHFLLTSDEPAP